MTLINKESRGSYNAVIANINQKVASLIDKIEALVSASEINSSNEEQELVRLNRVASNLRTYVSGLLEINKQMDAQMPDSCDYSWVYNECNECSFSCSEDDCGEACEE